MVKYNLIDIPVNFCNDGESKTIVQALGNIETGIHTQHDIDETYKKFCDETYEKFCSVIQNEMSTKLPKRNIIIRYGIQNKRRRIRNPWWNDDLQILWNDMCQAERAWLKCRNSQKHIF